MTVLQDPVLDATPAPLVQDLYAAIEITPLAPQTEDVDSDGHDMLDAWARANLPRSIRVSRSQGSDPRAQHFLFAAERAMAPEEQESADAEPDSNALVIDSEQVSLLQNRFIHNV